MKFFLTCYTVIALFVFSAACSAQASSATRSQQKELIWADEFDYTGLPDSSKWNYEEGMNRGVQKQYYTRQRMENAKVENGNLVITARKEKFKNPQYGSFRKTLSAQYPAKYKNMHRDSIPAWTRVRYDSVIDYTSASLITLNKFNFKYGRVEVRAKAPDGRGLSCAVWMLGENVKEVSWPKCGEIDIMECVGRDKSKINGTVHYMNAQNQHAQNGSGFKVGDAADEFHVYAIEWDSTSIKFFCDENMYYTFPVSQASIGGYNPFNHPFYLLMNVAIGSGKWAGPLDDAVLPKQMVIDYVRVYKL